MFIILLRLLLILKVVNWCNLVCYDAVLVNLTIFPCEVFTSQEAKLYHYIL